MLSAEAYERLTRTIDPRRVYAAGEAPHELSDLLLSELDRQSAEYDGEKDA